MYKLSHKATEDFGDIYEYTLLNFGPTQADQYTQDMDTCLTMLSSSPSIGLERDDIRAGIRSYYFQQHTIFFRVTEHGILVVRIINQRMNPALYLG